MVSDGRWKYIHASGFRPMLYDLESDPQEFDDRGADLMRRRDRAAAGSAVRLGAASQGHITTPNAKIAAYAENQLQIKAAC